MTVTTTVMGGGFGRRGEADVAVLATRIATKRPGVPIKLTWSREEDMRRDFYRPAAMARMRGVVDGGQAVAVDVSFAAASVIKQSMVREALNPLSQEQANLSGSDPEGLSGAYDQPYRIPHYRVRGHVTPSALPIGYWRAVGASYGGFFFDSFIDEMAHAAGQDPLAFRIAMAREELLSARRDCHEKNEDGGDTRRLGLDASAHPLAGDGCSRNWSECVHNCCGESGSPGEREAPGEQFARDLSFG